MKNHKIFVSIEIPKARQNSFNLLFYFNNRGKLAVIRCHTLSFLSKSTAGEVESTEQLQRHTDRQTLVTSRANSLLKINVCKIYLD